jgi:hypothetical protein
MKNEDRVTNKGLQEGAAAESAVEAEPWAQFLAEPRTVCALLSNTFGPLSLSHKETRNLFLLRSQIIHHNISDDRY